MYSSSPRKHKVHEVKRLNITSYILSFLAELNQRGMKMEKIRTLSDATLVRDFLNTPGDHYKTPFMVCQKSYNWQQVDFVPSNLGRGYIFYFICNRCRRKAKHLYQPYEYSQPRCRNCYHLSYKQPDRRTRKISRLIHQPYLSRDDRERIMKIAKGESWGNWIKRV